jgi:predicted Zn finger-like uncharacterized protein
MIVTCPACRTRYLVDDAELGGDAGRRVRCASCGNLWRYSSVAAAIQTAVAEATAEVEAAAYVPPPAAAYAPATTAGAPPPGSALRAEPGTQALPRPAGQPAPVRPAVVVELPGATRERGGRAGILGLIVFVAALALIAVLARDRIMATYPPAAPVYEALRLTEPPGTGLEITSSVTRTSDSLIVAGDITNGSAVPRPVGRLRVSLRDGARTDLETRIIDLPANQLPPGATAHYSTIFEHPSITATAADVVFATE